MSSSQKYPGPGWQALEVQGQETLGVSLPITALVKEDQGQKRRIECRPPWGLHPGSGSQLSSLPALPHHLTLTVSFQTHP